jgi:hypothetical protein
LPETQSRYEHPNPEPSAAEFHPATDVNEFIVSRQRNRFDNPFVQRGE